MQAKGVGTALIHDIQMYSKHHLVSKPRSSLLVKADRELDKLGTKSERKRLLAALKAQELYMEYTTDVAPDLDVLGCALALGGIIGSEDESKAAFIVARLSEELSRGHDFADGDAMVRLLEETGFERG